MSSSKQSREKESRLYPRPGCAVGYSGVSRESGLERSLSEGERGRCYSRAKRQRREGSWREAQRRGFIRADVRPDKSEVIRGRMHQIQKQQSSIERSRREGTVREAVMYVKASPPQPPLRQPSERHKIRLNRQAKLSQGQRTNAQRTRDEEEED